MIIEEIDCWHPQGNVDLYILPIRRLSLRPNPLNLLLSLSCQLAPEWPPADLNETFKLMIFTLIFFQPHHPLGVLFRVYPSCKSNTNPHTLAHTCDTGAVY